MDSVDAVPASSRRGRRPAGEDTRGRILDAARTELAAHGYDATSVRAVARRAGVDPALVRHYFASKAELLAASLVPGGVDAPGTVAGIVGGPLDTLGARLARTALGVWDTPEGHVRLRGMLSGTLSADPQATVFVDYVRGTVFGGLAAGLTAQGVPDAERRVSLVVSQVLGVLVARVVLQVEPLASASTDELAAQVAPTLQRYLTGPLAGPSAGPAAAEAAPGPSADR